MIVELCYVINILTSAVHTHNLALRPPTYSVPEGVPAPTVTNGIPGQVLVTWQTPDRPNGVIQYFTIERALGGEENFVQLGNVTAGSFLLFGDRTVEPFTEYDYRITAVNSAGSATGPIGSILTPETGQYYVYSVSLQSLFFTLFTIFPLPCLSLSLQLQKEYSLRFSL